MGRSWSVLTVQRSTPQLEIGAARLALDGVVDRLASARGMAAMAISRTRGLTDSPAHPA